MRQLKITKQITNRTSRSISNYLQDVGKYELVSAEEEVELARRIKKGDSAALDKLVNANLRFVVSVAKQYQHLGLTLEDLINEGNIGLVIAANRFDETKGFKFISYAVWWIRQSILRAVGEDARLIRLPQSQIGSLRKINQAFSRLEQEFEREPTADELASELDLDTRKLTATLRAASKTTSMDAPVIHDEPYSLADILENEDSPKADKTVMQESLSKDLESSLSTLNEKERDVVKLFFGIGRHDSMSLGEIAAEYDLTQERVRQIRDRAIKRLRRNSRNSMLKSYLG